MENPWISENLNKSRRFGELVMIRGSLHLFNILVIIDLNLGLPQLTKFYSFFSLRNTLNLKSGHINILVLTKEIYTNIYTTVYEHSYDRTCDWKSIIAWSCNRSYLFFFCRNNFFLTNPNNFNFLSVYSACSGLQLRITIVYNKGYQFV